VLCSALIRGLSEQPQFFGKAQTFRLLDKLLPRRGGPAPAEHAFKYPVWIIGVPLLARVLIIHEYEYDHPSLGIESEEQSEASEEFGASPISQIFSEDESPIRRIARHVIHHDCAERCQVSGLITCCVCPRLSARSISRGHNRSPPLADELLPRQEHPAIDDGRPTGGEGM